MFSHLQISDPRERMLVGIADAVLRVASRFRPRANRGRRLAEASSPSARSAPARPRRSSTSEVGAEAVGRKIPRPPGRILLLRLERIGDLLMSLDAIADIIRAAPDARVDLVVGSWNADLAHAIPGLARVETLDAAWLAREHTGLGMTQLLAHARGWRNRRYDLALNFEPDIRSNLLLAVSGAVRTAGFASGGGGPLLDLALPYDTRERTAENARRLAVAVLNAPPPSAPARLELPSHARMRAADIVGRARRPLIGVHASGGREIKQWDPARFAEVAVRLTREHGATIVLTGAPGDRAIVDVVARALPTGAAIDLVGALDLPTLAAVLEELEVVVTGDTGPMHLAAAVGTPVVAVFGPSDPARYAPPGEMHRIVRVSLPCSPCNRIRMPPARCVGHTPDCLTGVSAESVYRAVMDVLQRRESKEPALSERRESKGPDR